MTLSFVLLAVGLAHGVWTDILQRFVTPKARVDYARLAKEGLPALDGYLAALAKPWPAEMPPAARKAALINSYNALTVRWVTGHYPVASIWRTRHPFTAARHTVNGRAYSLDQIETQLRDMGDPRVHAVLVCAARSCPPLRREAYVAEKLDAQLDDNTRAWLANRALNEFDPTSREAEVSRIFEWYRGDFEKNGGTVGIFLAKHGPHYAAFLQSGNARIRYRDYYWGLNDSGSAGDSYGSAAFYFDYFRNKYF
ncbi:MAG: DUF547 domain-containing protein [Bryobacteraceae bacterium]